MGTSAQARFLRFLSALTAVDRLSEGEVRDALREQLARERLACDRGMVAIIREAQRQCRYVSSAMFDPLDKVQEALATGEAALERSLAEDPDPYGLRIVEACVEQMRAEYAAAEALRSARMSVAHADPADYWGRKRRDWDQGLGFLGGVEERQ